MARPFARIAYDGAAAEFPVLAGPDPVEPDATLRLGPKVTAMAVLAASFHGISADHLVARLLVAEINAIGLANLARRMPAGGGNT